MQQRTSAGKHRTIHSVLETSEEPQERTGLEGILHRKHFRFCGKQLA